MRNLSLLGIHTDSEHVVLVDQEGERYLLPINEELRSLVRQHRRKVVSALTAAPREDLRPRDIQTLIRGGATAEEVASSSGLDLEHVKRYETPVLAERSYVASQARDTQVSHEKEAPALGELVIDRLATRGVSPHTLGWDATRQPGENWMIHLEFVQDAKAMEANWEFNQDEHTLIALDEQARWLTETVTPAGSEALLNRTGQFRAAAFDVPAPPATDSASLANATDALLEELNAARGTRLSVVTDGEEDDVSAMEAAIASGFAEEDSPEKSASDKDLPPAPDSVVKLAKPAPATPEKTDSAKKDETGLLPGMEDLRPQQTVTHPETVKHSRSKGRAAMPSWDEILFGSKGN